MTLAAGARAVTAQDFMGYFRAVAVGPADFKLFGAVGGFDPGRGYGSGARGLSGLRTRLISHLCARN